MPVNVIRNIIRLAGVVRPIYGEHGVEHLRKRRHVRDGLNIRRLFINARRPLVRPSLEILVSIVLARSLLKRRYRHQLYTRTHTHGARRHRIFDRYGVKIKTVQRTFWIKRASARLSFSFAITRTSRGFPRRLYRFCERFNVCR